MAVNIGAVQRLTAPNPFALISTRKSDGGANLMALSWWTYVSNHPATVAVCLSKKGYSGELIQQTGEFGLNIVGEDLKQAAFSCGTCSGRTTDKARQFGISVMDSSVLSVPLVKGCRVALECKLLQVVDTADHDLFLAEVVEAHCDPAVKQLYAFDGYGRLDTV